MDPPPLVEGAGNISGDGRFLLVANHYQRKGMWILHPAAVITQAVKNALGQADPPMRWVVTANWPPWRMGPWKLASPGDILLPRVAHALWCYPVSLAGSNPAFTARSVRRLLREAPTLDCPIGLFPEGVAGVAGQLSPPLPGVERLIALLARAGRRVVPVGISERDRLVVRFGAAVEPDELLAAENCAQLALQRVADLMAAE